MKQSIMEIDKQERDFQRAKDVLGSLYGNRSGWIYQEEMSANPNKELIVLWEKEQSEFYKLKCELVLMDSNKIESVVATYTPQLMMENPKVAPRSN